MAVEVSLAPRLAEDPVLVRTDDATRLALQLGVVCRREPLRRPSGNWQLVNIVALAFPIVALFWC